MNPRILLQSRNICTSATKYGARNFRRFDLKEKRGTPSHQEELEKKYYEDEHLKYRFDRGVRPTGLKRLSAYEYEPIIEMIPEMIVPDLTGFDLKPYVSYRVPEVNEPQFKVQDLFHAVYSKKILRDFQNGKLDENGLSLEPSEAELLTPEQAAANARKTGEDLFCDKDNAIL